VDDHRLATGAGVIVAVDAPLGDDAIAVTVMGSNVDAHSDAADAGAHEFFRRGRHCHGKTTNHQHCKCKHTHGSISLHPLASSQRRKPAGVPVAAQRRVEKN
jgi:hypothetical protein